MSERPPPQPSGNDLSWQTAALGDRTVDSASVEFLLQAEVPETVSLAGGYPHPDLLPTRALAYALARAARRPDAAARPPLEGLSALRGWFARIAGGSVTAKDVLITTDDLDGHVIHIASLTKVTSPNLRIGALVARGPVAERLRALRVVDEFRTRPMQEAALELVSAPAWPRHLRTLSAALLERRNALIDALSRHIRDASLTRVPGGGLNLWLSLPGEIDDVVLAVQAREAGVLISPGRPYYAAEPPGPHIRLSFAGTPRIDQLDDGVRRLARALDARLTR